ncbi:glycosyl hydrolase [Parabacteroides timonensis]|uniref:glycosyl hydrolase n=1 Tax=Parabacteroides timonensis TaxID=1871013 RepID=UPI00094F3682|nr:glycosyl hydrolase [Parabacteroides timonensis]
MKDLLKIVLILFAFTGATRAQISPEAFADPEKQYRPIPLWFWNNTTVNETELLDQFRQMVEKDGYGGCAILPFGKNFTPEYLSKEYFSLYGAIIKEARKLDAHMSLYDEYGFPSGSMGAINADGTPRFMNKYPDATVKRLDKIEYNVPAGTQFRKPVPTGKLMAAVAMDTLSGKRLSLTSYIRSGELDWRAPAGAWKVFFFVCVKDGDPNVDYLDPEAVKLFVKETHQAYYDRFSGDFGHVIIETFFDEPTMYRAKGRMWTDKFNEKFTARYGYSPELLYPALWYNIGEETQSARNRLFGLRASLYAEGFMKTIQEWASAHGIYSTGHQDQEEILNPVSVAGDLMLCGKYMDIPGIDKIGGNRPAELFYKIISSSAYNWDKRQVMSETFGAMGNLTVKELYHIAMEQYAKGINTLIPHAVWYNDKDVTFLPELSWRNELYRDSLPAFNKFLTRLNYILQQEGRHVADIAMLYPIESLQGEHVLDGSLGFYEGGIRIPNTDYVHVSALLTDTLGRDFTYLHPEVLSTKCDVKDGLLHLDNKINKEAFRLIILPGMKTISLANLQKIASFHQAGGSVIFTTQLPEKSVEPGKDGEVKKIINRMLSESKRQSSSGKVFFIEKPAPEILKEKLAVCYEVPDVAFPDGQELNYIHKMNGGQAVYYFANLKDCPYHAEVVLRGKITPVLLDPHTGRQTDVVYKHQLSHGTEITSVILSIEKNSSVFIVDGR